MGYFLKKKNLLPYLDFLRKEKHFQVIAPVKNALGAPCFQELSDSKNELFLDSNTWFSAKKFFLPNKEREFLFERKGKSFKIHETIKHHPRVFFGLRSCDLHALNALDKLFLDFYGYDMLYRNKRNTALLIGLQCKEAGENCFCESMGTNVPDFFDLFFWEKSDGYFVEIGSDKWEMLYNKKFFEHTTQKKGSPVENCKLKLDIKGLEKLMEKNFNHPAWKKEAERCLSCSSCTQICPTCYCFTVQDFFLLDNNAERYREWGSCQLKQFTKIHGTIFRETRKSRLRQFVMHKLSYYKQEHDLHLCVGCGRCISACPVKISLVEIAQQIQKEHLEKVPENA